MKLPNNIVKNKKIEKSSDLCNILKLKRFINKYNKYIDNNKFNLKSRSKITNYRQQWANTIFNYNTKKMINISQQDSIVNNLIASYFNLYNKKVEKNKAKIKHYKSKYRKRSTKKIFFNFCNAKHTNNFVTLNLFTYNWYNKSIKKKRLKRLDIFYRARFKFNDSKLNTKSYIKSKKFITLKKHMLSSRKRKKILLLKKYFSLDKQKKKDWMLDINSNYTLKVNQDIYNLFKANKNINFENNTLNILKTYKKNKTLKNFEHIKTMLANNNIDLYNPLNIQYVNKRFSYLNMAKLVKQRKLLKKKKTIILVRRYVATNKKYKTRTSKNIFIDMPTLESLRYKTKNKLKIFFDKFFKKDKVLLLNKKNNYKKYRDFAFEIKTLHTGTRKSDIKYRLKKRIWKLKKDILGLNRDNKIIDLKKFYSERNIKLININLDKKFSKKFYYEKKKLIKNKLNKRIRLFFVTNKRKIKYKLRKRRQNFKLSKNFYRLNKNKTGLVKKYLKNIRKDFLKNKTNSKRNKLSYLKYKILKKKSIYINKKRKRNFLRKFFYRKNNNKITIKRKLFLKHNNKNNNNKNNKKITIKKKLLFKNRTIKTTRKFISFREKIRDRNLKRFTRCLLFRRNRNLDKNLKTLQKIQLTKFNREFKLLSKRLSNYRYRELAKLVPLYKILKIYKKHIYKNWIKNLKRKKLIIYYKQIFEINKLKFQEGFLIKLKNIISKLYKKNVKFNIIDLKYPHLDSNILTQIVCLKAKRRKYRIRYILRRRALKKRKIRMKKPKVFLYLNKNMKLNSIKNIYVSKISKKTKKKKIKDILNKNINKYYKNEDIIENIVFSSLKNKFIKGIRMEAAGRLTKRLVASRSVYKHLQIGSIRNFKSSYTGLYGYLLRGHADSSTQYTKLESKNRNGSFGLKGWISTM